MKSSTFIASVSSDISFPKIAMENVINYRKRKEKYHLAIYSLDQALQSRDLEGIITCSNQFIVKGNIRIRYTYYRKDKFETIQVPVKAAFLVTFAKGREGRYIVRLSASLN